MLVTNQMITQVYLVPYLSEKLQSWDRIRWYRSYTGRAGFYEQATDEDPQPAQLTGRLVTRALHNTSLVLRVGGTTEVVVPFQGADPYTLLRVAQEISAAAPDLQAHAGGDGRLFIATTLTGTAASLEVLASSAAANLGLLPGEMAVGLGADSALLNGVSEYQFTDHQSSPKAWYAVEYRNSTSGASSARSAPFKSREVESVPFSQLIGCFVRLADLAGRPLAGRRVTVHNVFMPNRATDGNKSWGIFRQYEELVTDPNGYCEAFLIRGAWVDVTIAGTGFTRRLRIPTTGTIVDLLDPSLDTEDEFGIQTSNVDFAIRTTT